MLAWITENLGTIVVSLVLILLVAGAIRTIRKEKKQGRSCCGGNCAHCGACSACKTTEKAS